MQYEYTRSLQCLLHLRYNILYFHIALLLAGACFKFFLCVCVWQIFKLIFKINTFVKR